METPAIQSLCPGRYWQDIKAGDRFRTLRRTISEPDLVSFIAATGMLEAIFIDQTFDSAMQGRAVPGALTCGLIEGLQFQTLLQATGLAHARTLYEGAQTSDGRRYDRRRDRDYRGPADFERQSGNRILGDWHFQPKR